MTVKSSSRSKSAREDKRTGDDQKEHRDRPSPPFVYPPANRFESYFYWTALIACQFYAYYAVYTASKAYDKQPFRHYLPVSPYEKWLPSSLSGKLVDLTNWEWSHWTRNYLPYMLPWLFGHSLVFNLSETYLQRPAAKILCVAYWIAAVWFITSSKMIAFIFVEFILIYTISYITRNILVVWGTAGFVLYIYTAGVSDLWHKYIGDLNVEDLLCEIMVLTYKQLQIISFCIELSKRPKGPFWRGFGDLIYYSFYLPYVVSLVRIYPKFEQEMRERQSTAFNIKSVLWFGLRIAFWIVFIEVSLHLCYSEAMMTDAAFLRKVSIDQLCSIGYATLHFFHLKYVAIFGLGQFFAKLDSMQPMDLPMCPGHVNVFMKIWRYFDIGLYDFFKNYIYIPIVSPTFTIFRKFIGFLIIYLFVLLWHGFKHQYLVWIAIMLLEVFSVIISKAIYAAYLKEWRERHLSDTMFRRIVAFLQIWTITTGIYGCFYFLGGSASGWVFADRVFWKRTLPPNWQVYLMFAYGYVFNQCCMDCCIYDDRKKEMRKEDKDMKKD